MDVTLQRHCAKFIYVIPDGLRELTSDISREVLRSQPEDIYTFIADYLDALLITRENARVAARLVNTITQIAITTVELLERTGMSYDDAERIVAVIQEVFRKHMNISDKSAMVLQSEDVEDANVITEIFNLSTIPEDVAEEAAEIIQNAYRKFKARRETEKEILKGMIDWRIAARSAIHLYRKTGVTKPEADRAATLIKAAYKGYYTRRIIKQLGEEDKEEKLSEEEDVFEMASSGTTSSFHFDLASSSTSSTSAHKEEIEGRESGILAAKEIVGEIMKRAIKMIDPSIENIPEQAGEAAEKPADDGIPMGEQVIEEVATETEGEITATEGTDAEEAASNVPEVSEAASEPTADATTEPIQPDTDRTEVTEPVSEVEDILVSEAATTEATEVNDASTVATDAETTDLETTDAEATENEEV